jgi:hypothetical protein
MGEIKSTLDLVLERTRHLSLSPAEREAQRQKEARGRVGGLLQQWVDRLLDAAEITARLEALHAEFGPVHRALLFDAALERIDPQANDAANSRLIELLREVYGAAVEGIERALSDLRVAREHAAGQRAAELKRELAAGRAISGTAVVPNLEADPVFQERAARLRAECGQRLAAEGAGLRAQM